MNLIDEARERAVEVLQRCSTPIGFKASGLARGYPHVWARDSIITALGAAWAEPALFMRPLRASLDTLGAFQSSLGLIPLNVDVASQTVSTENAGAVDANLWFILGHYYHWLLTHDDAYLRAAFPRLQRALLWLRYQDMNECGLLEVPEAGDWMDLLSVRYNVLYDNALYFACLIAFARMATACDVETGGAQAWADGVQERLNLLLWVNRRWEPELWAEQLARLKAMRLEWYMLYHDVGTISSRPFYLPWVAFREFGDYCDVLGNILAILTGVADRERREIILRHLYQVGVGSPYPSKAIHPVIYPGQAEWREYYRSRNLNLPHQYHNGGIWPFIGGFHVAALVRQGWLDDAARLLQDLAAANRRGAYEPWEFNEWLHGQTGNPMGYPLQAWSAGMYLYAYEALRQRRLPLFDDLIQS